MGDPVTDAFNRRCGVDRDLARSMDAAVPHLPAWYREFWHGKQLPRPLFVPHGEITGFGAQLRSLFDLLVELPGRVFDGDLDLYCKAAGIDQARARQVRRFAHRPPVFFGRADAYRSGGSFKVLEFNVCSAVGGFDSPLAAKALLHVPAFRAFAEEHGLTYADAGRALATTLRDAAGTGEPNVAIIVPDGELAGHRYLELYAALLAGFGLRAAVAEIGSVVPRGGRLYLRGEPVDVVLRFLSDAELTSAAATGPAAEAILRAHEDGHAVLWTGMENQRVNNKGALALLADEDVRSALTPHECEVIDRALPWTRRLTGDLVERCRADRERLLLKPSFGHGGLGLVLGWQTDDAAWAEALRTGIGESWVVQERVVPDEEPVVDPDTGAVRPWSAVWGVLVTPSGYAGSHIRAVPADPRAPIISGQSPGARRSAAFHHPGTGSTGA